MQWKLVAAPLKACGVNECPKIKTGLPCSRIFNARGVKSESPDAIAMLSACPQKSSSRASMVRTSRRYREPDKLMDDGSEIEWPVPYWWVDIGATMMVV